MKDLERMTDKELWRELEFTRECLKDEKEVLAFMLTKTTLHLGAEEFEAMIAESDQKCREYIDRIKKIEAILE